MNRLQFVAGASAALTLSSGVFLAWYARMLSRPADRLQHAADAVLPAASIIKLLIAETVISNISSHRLRLDTVLSVSKSDDADGSQRFVPGTTASVSDLLTAMLSYSDNTAANALLRCLGFARCNARAASLGLRATRVRRSFYDWNAERRGIENTTTARESALLMEHLAALPKSRNPLTVAAATIAMRALLSQEDKETIPSAITRHTIIANKTGELPNIRHDVAIVGYGSPHAYVLAILSRFGGSRASAVAAIRRVAQNIDAHFRVQSAASVFGPAAIGEKVANISVAVA